jgi:hypothetical protein
MASDALFAGVICGQVLALVTAPLIALLLLLVQPNEADAPGFRLPPILTGLRPMMLAVPVFVFGLVIWSMVGLLFGVLFLAIHRGPVASLPGTPDVFYAAIVVILCAQAAALLSFGLRRVHWAVLAITALAVVLFGWVLPNLALLNQ